MFEILEDLTQANDEVIISPNTETGYLAFHDIENAILKHSLDSRIKTTYPLFVSTPEEGTELLDVFINTIKNDSLTNIIGLGTAKKENKNLTVIIDKFNLELDKYSHYLIFPEKIVRSQFTSIATEISKLKNVGIVVELTPLNSVKLKIKLDDEKILVVTHIFKEDFNLENNMVVFNFLVNRKPVVNDVAQLSELVKGFNNYIEEESQ